MQNQDTTGTSGISRSPNPTGCRIRKPAYDRAREATEAWNGQEGGFDHWAALEMLEADGVPERLGLRTRHVDYLRKSFRKLRSSDFENPTWSPVVWMKKTKIARKLGVHPRTVTNIEKDLARAGFLYWTDTASRRRDGRRSPHDGRILWAYGVDFSPFAARAAEIEAVARQVKEDEIECEGLIHEIATIRCHTTILLKAAFRRPDIATAAIEPLLTQALSLPTAKAMECAGIDSLRALAETARHIQQQATLLTEPPAAETDTPRAPESSPTVQLDSAENFTLGSTFESGFNSTTDQFQENTLGAAEPPTPPNRTEDTAAARPRPERGNCSWVRPRGVPVDGGPPEWLLLQSLGPDFDRFLPADRSPTADEFYRAANQTRSKLGISPEAWHEACRTLSPGWASLAVVVIASRNDAGEIYSSPGGYFRKMAERAVEGSLNLAGSLWGVVERAERLHVSGCQSPGDTNNADQLDRLRPARPGDRQ